jgi:hypothetical protein
MRCEWNVLALSIVRAISVAQCQNPNRPIRKTTHFTCLPLHIVQEEALQDTVY